MQTAWCFREICFHQLSASDPKLFGFAEFLTGLALMVVVWTIADVRYRFRIAIAPLPLLRGTFVAVACLGLLTLITDVWRARGGYVPDSSVMTSATWQGLLGAVFLATFLIWAWFAFVRPPTYGAKNAKKFYEALYEAVLRSNPAELAVIADELGDSVRALVVHAPTGYEIRELRKSAPGDGLKAPALIAYAHDTLLLLADPRFVKALVGAAPRTALFLFESMSALRRYPAALRTFVSNFVAESIENKNSFVYHETKAYETGLIGEVKPLTTAMFARYDMLDELDSLLDVRFPHAWQWDATQLSAYCRLVLLALKTYIKDEYLGTHSPMLYRAFQNIVTRTMDVATLDGKDSIALGEDAYERLRIAAGLISDSIKVLSEVPVPTGTRLRTKDIQSSSIYDLVAKTAVDLVHNAAYVRGPRMTCWHVQHNAVWARLFGIEAADRMVSRLIQHKIRRLLYDAVMEMDRFPNFQAARFLALCLNVLGHRKGRGRMDRAGWPLKVALLAWVRRRYSWLYATRPAIAEHCLVDTMSYDPRTRRILFARLSSLGIDKPKYTYFQVD